MTLADPNPRQRARNVQFFPRWKAWSNVVMILMVVGRLAAADVWLAWNPSVSTNVVGYKIYLGAASRAYTNAIDAGNETNAMISGLIPGATYYFAATGYCLQGIESSFSSEIVYSVPLVAAGSNAFSLSRVATIPKGAVLMWITIPAKTYLVFYKNKLGDRQWLTGSPPLVATGKSLVWVDTGARTNSQRYYRVESTP